ncbi:MAG: hypothetical protein ACYT04_32090 [Nostoc sp.]
MALLHPHRSARYEGKRTYTSDRYKVGGMRSPTSLSSDATRVR